MTINFESVKRLGGWLGIVPAVLMAAYGVDVIVEHGSGADSLYSSIKEWFTGKPNVSERDLTQIFTNPLNVPQGGVIQPAAKEVSFGVAATVVGGLGALKSFDYARGK